MAERQLRFTLVAGVLAGAALACGEPGAVARDTGPEAEQDAAIHDAHQADLRAADSGPGRDISSADGAAGLDSAPGVDHVIPDAAIGIDVSSGQDAGPDCPVEPCLVISQLPFTHSDDTSQSPLDSFDSYACQPGTSEAGPEQVYQLSVDEAGTLIAMLDDGGDVGADIDIHLLDALDPSSCLARGHIGLSANITAGTYYLVADSWTNASGVAQAGAYTLYVRFLRQGSNCAMLGEAIARINDTEALAMPATGPVVKEAHLVSDQEFGGSAWPSSITDGIDAHYSLSESVSGYSMTRTEPWAPCCEPSNEYGQGSSVRPPVEAEAFYLNMRWSSAPPRGQRYILFDGRSGRAVVGAAGYENGPGDLSRIGGACEEVHHHLGTAHLSVFTFGVAADQGLEYGPITCEE